MIKNTLTLLLTLNFGLALPNADLIDLVPNADSFPELNPIGEPQIFTGNQLYTMIDGGAEVYLEYGFIEALSLSYLQDGKNRLDIQLYRMEDAGAAYGMLTHSKSSQDTIIDVGFLLIRSPYFIMFQKDNYFGVLSWSKIDPINNTTYTKLVAYISTQIHTISAFPRLLVKALEKEYSHNEIKYIEGNLALAAIHFFSHKNLFQIEEAIYLMDKGYGNYFIFAYNDSEKVTEVWKGIQDEFSVSTKVTNYIENENSLRYTDRRNRNILMVATENTLGISINHDSSNELVEMAMEFSPKK